MIYRIRFNCLFNNHVDPVNPVCKSLEGGGPISILKELSGQPKAGRERIELRLGVEFRPYEDRIFRNPRLRRADARRRHRESARGGAGGLQARQARWTQKGDDLASGDRCGAASRVAHRSTQGSQGRQVQPTIDCLSEYKGFIIFQPFHFYCPAFTGFQLFYKFTFRVRDKKFSPGYKGKFLIVR